MRAVFLAALPIVLGWFAMEIKWWIARRKQEQEQRERDSRRRIP